MAELDDRETMICAMCDNRGPREAFPEYHGFSRRCPRCQSLAVASLRDILDWVRETHG